ncbi:MAG: hypothetical protein A2X86_18895 [Bdellovibrionales bacterium GWA2_49_15]|nr:MAG: hypothetical protein A2X86_18895 [Bdellovibrionales bacterium GWA2_49_15]HAZ14294.1 hypothetical protein [Bdellovibrionales bacterium]
MLAKKIMLLLALLLSFNANFALSASSGVTRDYFMAYTDFKKMIQWELVSPANFKTNLPDGMGQIWNKEDQRAWIDALWDLIEEEGPQNKYIAFLEHPISDALPEIRLRYFYLMHKYVDQAYIDSDYLRSLDARLSKRKAANTKVNLEEIYLFYSLFEKVKHPVIGNQYIKLMKVFPQVYSEYKFSTDKATLTHEEVRSVFEFNPDLNTYQQGEYVDAVRVYVFCRPNRDYPCRVLIKQPNGELHHGSDGVSWNGMALAASSKGLPAQQRNGQTPMGVQSLDSVMPEANFPELFGQYRRVILNWIPNSTNFVQNKLNYLRRPEPAVEQLLPASVHASNWWRQATLARDIGRVDLRMHGTGRPPVDRTLPWFPFRKTSGCIAQREAVVDGETIHDQRVLLDNLMAAKGLSANFENETQIKGLLYLMEVEGEGPLTLANLEAVLGIQL